MFFLNFCFLSILFKSKYQTDLKLDNNISENSFDKNELTNILNNNTNFDYRINHGIDMRYKNYTDFDINLNLKLKNYFRKMQILKTLENSNISELDKIKIINDNDIFNYNYSSNINAGGLMNDFDFNF